MSTLRQLAKEFSLPLLAALCWVAANLYLDARLPSDVLKHANLFFAAFFFASWLSSQWFRVRKQLKQERDLKALNEKTSALLSDFDARTKQMIANITGGDSYALLYPWISENEVSWSITLHGVNPLTFVTVEIVEIDSAMRAGKPAVDGGSVVPPEGDWRKFRVIGGLSPAHVNRPMMPFPLKGDVCRFAITTTALNGTIFQRVKMVRSGGRWLYAEQAFRNNGPLRETGVENLPKNAEGQPDWH